MKRIIWIVLFFVFIAAVAACTAFLEPPGVPHGEDSQAAAASSAAAVPRGSDSSDGSGSAVKLANPASEFCIEQGGRLMIKTRGDGGEFGVCYFEDNRQCEEWALLRGDCPVGGLKITGYVTEAAQYCAITGGKYRVTDESGAPEDEQGTCTFANGAVCDVWDYFNGQCSGKTAGTSQDGINGPQEDAACAELATAAQVALGIPGIGRPVSAAALRSK